MQTVPQHEKNTRYANIIRAGMQEVNRRRLPPIKTIGAFLFVSKSKLELVRSV